MSFKGYYQVICVHGHYTEEDIPHAGYALSECYTCDAAIAWKNLVNDTNFDAHGEIDFKILQEQFLIKKNEDHYDNDWDVFRVPTLEETEALRSYKNFDGERVLLKEK